jgi:hypothetical protein
MPQFGRTLLTALLGVAVVAAIFVSGFYFGTQRGAEAIIPGEFGQLTTVRAMLERSFIGEIPTTQKQAWGAAHGTLAGSAPIWVATMRAGWQSPSCATVPPLVRE